jgi:superoxide dismutase
LGRANPLVVCDVAPHAYSEGLPAQEDYVAKFLEHIDWEEVARRYRAVDRM